MTHLNGSSFLDEQSSPTHFLPGLLRDVSYISSPVDYSSLNLLL